MFEKLKEVAYKALSPRQYRSRQRHGGSRAMHSYKGLYSLYHARERQAGGSSESATRYKSFAEATYRPAAFEPSPSVKYSHQEYDVFAPPEQQKILRGPIRPLREHEVERMQRRLWELHDMLADMGCTADTPLDEVPPHLREDVREVLHERRQIARHLGDLVENIAEVEKAIDEQRIPHSLDETFDRVAADEEAEDGRSPVRNQEPYRGEDIEVLLYAGGHGAAGMPEPSDLLSMEAAETAAEDEAIGMSLHQHEDHCIFRARPPRDFG